MEEMDVDQPKMTVARWVVELMLGLEDSAGETVEVFEEERGLEESDRIIVPAEEWSDLLYAQRTFPDMFVGCTPRDAFPRVKKDGLHLLQFFHFWSSLPYGWMQQMGREIKDSDPAMLNHILNDVDNVDLRLELKALTTGEYPDTKMLADCYLASGSELALRCVTPHLNEPEALSVLLHDKDAAHASFAYAMDEDKLNYAVEDLVVLGVVPSAQNTADALTKRKGW